MTKIYTKKGDAGETDLISGERVSKDDLRIEAYGTVDEINSLIGAARAAFKDPELDGALGRIQEDLFRVGAFLASRRSPDLPQGGLSPIGESNVRFLEEAIDRLSNELAPLKNFILPGGSAGASWLHLARAVCRRAERLVVALGRKETVGRATLVYLNRLSDFLFVAARFVNHTSKIPEVIWPGKS